MKKDKATLGQIVTAEDLRRTIGDDAVFKALFPTRDKLDDFLKIAPIHFETTVYDPDLERGAKEFQEELRKL